MTPKSARTAAIVSQVLLIAWAVFSLTASIFQDNLLALFGIPTSIIEDTKKASSWAVIAMCAANLLLTAANVLICNGKCVYSPIIMSAVTTGLLPVAVTYLNVMQLQIIARLRGSDAFARMSAYNQAAAFLSYLLYAGAIITIAASAVYAYAKKQDKNGKAELTQE